MIDITTENENIYTDSHELSLVIPVSLESLYTDPHELLLVIPVPLSFINPYIRDDHSYLSPTSVPEP